MSVKAGGTEGMPLGREYWQQQAAKKEAEGPTPWKSPEGTNHVPLVEIKKVDPEIIKKHLAQNGEYGYIEVLTEFKPIKSLSKNFKKIEEKPIMNHYEVPPRGEYYQELQGEPTLERGLNNIAESLPEEDRAAFNAAENKVKFVQQYLSEHPDFKPSMGVTEKAQNTNPVDEMMKKTDLNNEVKAGEEKVADVWEEFTEFTNKYFDSISDDMTMDEKYENRTAYYNAYKSFITRLLKCADVTEEQKAEYADMEANADTDMTLWETEYQNYKDSAEPKKPYTPPEITENS